MLPTSSMSRFKIHVALQFIHKMVDMYVNSLLQITGISCLYRTSFFEEM